jgi:subtilisin family serine protease
LAEGWAVYSRTDQLIAGLERAVDPNEDGDAHDAARIALVPLAAPYAAFADSPDARAVEGALDLDTLVVAAAGNDGPAGPAFGSLSSPGASPDALSVGAADLRSQTEEVRVVVRVGLEVVVDRLLPLAGAVLPRHARELALAAPRERSSKTSPGDFLAPPPLNSFFNKAGLSVVAGRAALVRAGDDPVTAVENAARAGAAAVVLYGTAIPAVGWGWTRAFPCPSSPSRATLPGRRSTRSQRGGIRLSRSAPRVLPETARAAAPHRFRLEGSRSTGASGPTCSARVWP